MQDFGSSAGRLQQRQPPDQRLAHSVPIVDMVSLGDLGKAPSSSAASLPTAGRLLAAVTRAAPAEASVGAGTHSIQPTSTVPTPALGVSQSTAGRSAAATAPPPPPATRPSYQLPPASREQQQRAWSQRQREQPPTGSHSSLGGSAAQAGERVPGKAVPGATAKPEWNSFLARPGGDLRSLPALPEGPSPLGAYPAVGSRSQEAPGGTPASQSSPAAPSRFAAVPAVMAGSRPVPMAAAVAAGHESSLPPFQVAAPALSPKAAALAAFTAETARAGPAAAGPRRRAGAATAGPRRRDPLGQYKRPAAAATAARGNWMSSKERVGAPAAATGATAALGATGASMAGLGSLEAAESLLDSQCEDMEQVEQGPVAVKQEEGPAAPAGAGGSGSGSGKSNQEGGCPAVAGGMGAGGCAAGLHQQAQFPRASGLNGVPTSRPFGPAAGAAERPSHAGKHLERQQHQGSYRVSMGAAGSGGSLGGGAAEAQQSGRSGAPAGNGLNPLQRPAPPSIRTLRGIFGSMGSRPGVAEAAAAPLAAGSPGSPGSPFSPFSAPVTAAAEPQGLGSRPLMAAGAEDEEGMDVGSEEEGPAAGPAAAAPAGYGFDDWEDAEMESGLEAGETELVEEEASDSDGEGGPAVAAGAAAAAEQGSGSGGGGPKPKLPSGITQKDGGRFAASIIVGSSNKPWLLGTYSSPESAIKAHDYGIVYINHATTGLGPARGVTHHPLEEYTADAALMQELRALRGWDDLKLFLKQRLSGSTRIRKTNASLAAARGGFERLQPQSLTGAVPSKRRARAQEVAKVPSAMPSKADNNLGQGLGAWWDSGGGSYSRRCTQSTLSVGQMAIHGAVLEKLQLTTSEILLCEASGAHRSWPVTVHTRPSKGRIFLQGPGMREALEALQFGAGDIITLQPAPAREGMSAAYISVTHRAPVPAHPASAAAGAAACVAGLTPPGAAPPHASAGGDGSRGGSGRQAGYAQQQAQEQQVPFGGWRENVDGSYSKMCSKSIIRKGYLTANDAMVKAFKLTTSGVVLVEASGSHRSWVTEVYTGSEDKNDRFVLQGAGMRKAIRELQLAEGDTVTLRPAPPREGKPAVYISVEHSSPAQATPASTAAGTAPGPPAGTAAGPQSGAVPPNTIVGSAGSGGGSGRQVAHAQQQAQEQHGPVGGWRDNQDGSYSKECTKSVISVGYLYVNEVMVKTFKLTAAGVVLVEAGGSHRSWVTEVYTGPEDKNDRFILQGAGMREAIRELQIGIGDTITRRAAAAREGMSAAYISVMHCATAPAAPAPHARMLYPALRLGPQSSWWRENEDGSYSKKCSKSIASVGYLPISDAMLEKFKLTAAGMVLIDAGGSRRSWVTEVYIGPQRDRFQLQGAGMRRAIRELQVAEEDTITLRPAPAREGKPAAYISVERCAQAQPPPSADTAVDELPRQRSGSRSSRRSGSGVISYKEEDSEAESEEEAASEEGTESEEGAECEEEPGGSRQAMSLESRIAKCRQWGILGDGVFSYTITSAAISKGRLSIPACVNEVWGLEGLEIDLVHTSPSGQRRAWRVHNHQYTGTNPNTLNIETGFAGVISDLGLREGQTLELRLATAAESPDQQVPALHIQLPRRQQAQQQQAQRQQAQRAAAAAAPAGAAPSAASLPSRPPGPSFLRKLLSSARPASPGSGAAAGGTPAAAVRPGGPRASAQGPTGASIGSGASGAAGSSPAAAELLGWESEAGGSFVREVHKEMLSTRSRIALPVPVAKSLGLLGAYTAWAVHPSDCRWELNVAHHPSGSDTHQAKEVRLTFGVSGMSQDLKLQLGQRIRLSRHAAVDGKSAFGIEVVGGGMGGDRNLGDSPGQQALSVMASETAMGGQQPVAGKRKSQGGRSPPPPESKRANVQQQQQQHEQQPEAYAAPAAAAPLLGQSTAVATAPLFQPPAVSAAGHAVPAAVGMPGAMMAGQAGAGQHSVQQGPTAVGPGAGTTAAGGGAAASAAGATAAAAAGVGQGGPAGAFAPLESHEMFAALRPVVSGSRAAGAAAFLRIFLTRCDLPTQRAHYEHLMLLHQEGQVGEIVEWVDGTVQDFARGR